MIPFDVNESDSKVSMSSLVISSFTQTCGAVIYKKNKFTIFQPPDFVCVVFFKHCLKPRLDTKKGRNESHKKVMVIKKYQHTVRTLGYTIKSKP